MPHAGDAAFLLRLTNDPDWLRFIGDRGVHNEQDAVGYLNRSLLPSFQEHGFGLFVVETLADKSAIGICGLVRRPHLDAPDLGFAFLPDHRGHGYALEAGSAALEDAHTRLGLNRILAITRPDNEASIRVLERLGMRALQRLKGPGDPPLRLFGWEASPPSLTDRGH